MKTTILILSMAMLLAAACATRQAVPNAAAPSVKVGVYDSRAIAVAYAGSPFFNAWMTDFKARYEKAKSAGDEAALQALNSEVEGSQKKMHMQGFSTAPVDDILAVIQDKLPGIAKKAGVGPMISKWDKDALAKYPGAERLDVTMALVQALEPDERRLKVIPEVLKTQPLPLEEMEKMSVDE